VSLSRVLAAALSSSNSLHSLNASWASGTVQINAHLISNSTQVAGALLPLPHPREMNNNGRTMMMKS
jgi:hypothetical protein